MARAVTDSVKIRFYKTAPGFWAVTLIHHSAGGHWSCQLGRWVITTEPGDD